MKWPQAGICKCRSEVSIHLHIPAGGLFMFGLKAGCRSWQIATRCHAARMSVCLHFPSIILLILHPSYNPYYRLVLSAFPKYLSTWQKFEYIEFGCVCRSEKYVWDFLKTILDQWLSPSPMLQDLYRFDVFVNIYLLVTTASGPGPRSEKVAACSYISADSSLLHTYDPYGRRTMCCARSSLQPKMCSPKCAQYAASSTRKDEDHHPVYRLSGSLKRKHEHGKVLSQGNYVIENGQKIRPKRPKWDIKT